MGNAFERIDARQGTVLPVSRRLDLSFNIRQGLCLAECPGSKEQRIDAPPPFEWPVPIAAATQAAERE